jgi:hypothetical protein
VRRLLAVAALVLSSCAAPPPLPPGTPSFALLGDIPYSDAHVNALDTLIDEMNDVPLAFVAHIGDITAGQGPCSDKWLEARKAQFARIAHPFVLLPGDNDWTDCHRSGFDPLERLAKWRSLFCLDDSRLRIERQSALDARFPEYCEHRRWQLGDLLFVALNVPGSNNNLDRRPATRVEHERRMSAVFAWLEASLELAQSRGASRVVVLMHANPGFEQHRGLRAPGVPDGFESIRNALAAHADRAPGRIVLVHGDTHTYRNDSPLPGLHRIEVYGWPHSRWLRAWSGPDGLAVEPGF